MPVQSAKIKAGRLGMHPLDWVEDAVQEILTGYYEACGQ
jgi:tagatose-1,6-bisphosphate aldolase non-catalytic subunit AgaZ/GatZ